MAAAVSKANRLKATHGMWACTKGYSQTQLAALEGGRYEAWRIQKHGSGDGWQDDVTT